MGLRLGISVSAVLVALAAPSAASAATVAPDVPSGFWAASQIGWSIDHGWMRTRSTGAFAPASPATRNAAARVLGRANRLVNGVPVQSDPFVQAVNAGWITAGAGRAASITQLELDRGVARVLGIAPSAARLATFQTADGWRPALPRGFGTEQVVREAGGRINVPSGSDQWETW